jgi:acyl-homoserine-lactone acylase
MNAYADGINYYLYKHPNIKPALLTGFKPWYTLLWTDGSIGAIDVAGCYVNELRNFYSGSRLLLHHSLQKKYDPLPGGSNGFAIAPSKTASGNAILYISTRMLLFISGPKWLLKVKRGLHAYGAVTWGQFFIYQGFNEHCGWMHTSSYSDVADCYIENVTKKDGFCL